MNTMAITIKIKEATNLLNIIADKLYEDSYKVKYAHLFFEDNNGVIYLEVDDVSNPSDLISFIQAIPEVISVIAHKTLEEIYGKRVIIVGDGEVMYEALHGAIMEAEYHNANGEKISVDGMIIVGGTQIQEAINTLLKLPRVNALVLSGTMMGGKITEELFKLKEEYENLQIVAIDMLGDVDSVADVVINDPEKAGAMAVKLISNVKSNEIV